MNCKFNMFPPSSVIDSHVKILLDDGTDVSFTTKGAIQAIRILSEFLSRAAEIQGAPAEQFGEAPKQQAKPEKRLVNVGYYNY